MNVTYTKRDTYDIKLFSLNYVKDYVYIQLDNKNNTVNFFPKFLLIMIKDKTSDLEGRMSRGSVLVGEKIF